MPSDFKVSLSLSSYYDQSLDFPELHICSFFFVFCIFSYALCRIKRLHVIRFVYMSDVLFHFLCLRSPLPLLFAPFSSMYSLCLHYICHLSVYFIDVSVTLCQLYTTKNENIRAVLVEVVNTRNDWFNWKNITIIQTMDQRQVSCTSYVSKRVTQSSFT